MFVISKVVGAMCAICDTEDGSVEWYSKQAVKGLIVSGIKVDGVDGNTYTESRVTLSKDLLSDILAGKADRLNGVFRFVTADKSWKFEYVCLGGDTVELYFTNGVRTVVDKDWFHSKFEKYLEKI